jgi:hypothetical protein
MEYRTFSGSKAKALYFKFLKAIRLLCLWTRGAYPPELQDKLYHAIKFIVEVYAVSWFEIKRDSNIHNQQLYIFNMKAILLDNTNTNTNTDWEVL